MPQLLQTNKRRISLRDRWVALGTTGSGKTTFARKLTRYLQSAYPGLRIYIVDSKGMDDFMSFKGKRVTSDKAPAALAHPGLLIWTPGLDNTDEYSDFFENILKARKPAFVLVDELSSLGGHSGRSFPLGYMKLNKQGRGCDISMMSLTQEAAYIPRTTLGQVTHLLRFSLQNDYDKKLVDKMLGKEANEPEDTFGFFYKRLDQRGAVRYFPDFRQFFSTKKVA